MSSGRERRYWDSSCFIALIKGEIARLEACRSIVADAEEGAVEIVTSALTIAEVTKGPEPERPSLTREDEDKIRSYFENDYILVVNLDRRAAEEARQLCWAYGLHPRDALHLAAAQMAKAEVFETYDEALLRRHGMIGEPPLTIRHPLPKPRQMLLPMDAEAERD